MNICAVIGLLPRTEPVRVGRVPAVPPAEEGEGEEGGGGRGHGEHARGGDGHLGEGQLMVRSKISLFLLNGIV